MIGSPPTERSGGGFQQGTSIFQALSALSLMELPGLHRARRGGADGGSEENEGWSRERRSEREGDSMGDRMTVRETEMQIS